MNTSPATTDHPEQLTFLPAPPAPVQFRLDEATRRRGLAHVAQIRAQLERASEARSGTGEQPRQLRRRNAASRAA